MARRSRKNEREALKAVISHASQDIEQVLADGAVAAIDSFMDSREFYVVGLEIEPGSTGLYGPYLSKSEAEKALKRLSSPLANSPSQAAVLRLYGIPEEV